MFIKNYRSKFRWTVKCIHFNPGIFSKWIVILLKFFDFCGFQTESDINAHKIRAKQMFLIHFVWIFTLTCFAISFSLKPKTETALPYWINLLLQFMNGIITNWIIIIESYKQRKIQRKFWHIYEQIKRHYKHCKQPILKVYSIVATQYFVVIIGIQFFFLTYYMQHVENSWYFRLAYLTTQITYHYRIFYYIFYLEIIKFELNITKNEFKNMSIWTKFHSTFFQRKNPRIKKYSYRRNSWCHSAIKCLYEKNLKRIYGDCQLMYEMCECINQSFGMSSFATILYCFHMPLADGNWALHGLSKRPIDYILGQFIQVTMFVFHY